MYSFFLLVVVAAVYRAIPGRPWGFAPQLAMAIFSGSVVKDKKWAFAFPLISLIISDALYQLLYINGMFEIPGFYNGMLSNYVLFGSITVFGLFTNADKLSSIAKSSFFAPTAFFLISNLMVWMGNGGYHRPQTFSGLMQVYTDGLPFYTNSIIATVVFSGLLFGVHKLIRKFNLSAAH